MGVFARLTSQTHPLSIKELASRMLKFLLHRLVWMIPVLLLILVIVFLLGHLMPGSPWSNDAGGRRAMSNISMDEATRKALDRRFGLDDPLWKQFASYMIGRVDQEGAFVCGLVCGNMGPSFRQRGRSVNDILFGAPTRDKTILESRFIYSLRLSGYAFLMAAAIGIPLGIFAALRANTWTDYLIKGLASLLISMPNFVIGLLMIIVLGGSLHLITISPINWDEFTFKTWFAPIFILGIGMTAAFIRLTRASILDVMRRDFIRTARSKGAPPPRVIALHVVKNAAIPLVTFSGPALLELFAGSFVIEFMFGFPGMASEFIRSVVARDYLVIMGVTLVYALLIAGTNLIADLAYGMIDPRIRVEQAGGL